MATAFAATERSLFNENQWFIRMEAITTQPKEPKDKDVDALHSIFDVPKVLFSTKPEAYTPHIFAIGPYHKRRHELYEMELHKANAVRQAEGEVLLKGCEFKQVVEAFTADEKKIRTHYHRYLDYNGRTLAWMMAIDACFVLTFLRTYYSGGKPATANELPAETWLKDATVRDIIMLENQIPLFLFQKIVETERPTEGAGINYELLLAFIIHVSPFKRTKNLHEKLHHLLATPEKQRHLLQILYDAVTPAWKERRKDCVLEIERRHLDSTVKIKYQIPIQHHPNSTPAIEYEHPKSGAQGPVPVAGDFASLGGSVGNLLKSFGGNAVKAAASGVNAATLVIQKGVASVKPPANAQCSMEEIRIPKVTDLHGVGVKFVPTRKGIEGIRFDARRREFHLPVIYVDHNTEVIVRNLVAYEATTVRGQLIFARFTELMNGIVDTDRDLRLLRTSGIIQGDLGDKKALDFWNGMNRSVRATQVPQLDEEIKALNKFYDNHWKVKARSAMKKRVYDSWRFLAFMSTLVVVLTNVLQAYCSVHKCGHWFGSGGTGK